MKLSTELFLCNIVLLLTLWWCAFQGMTVVTACLLVAMFVVRFLSVRAARMEAAAEHDALRERIKVFRAKIEERKNTEKPQ